MKISVAQFRCLPRLCSPLHSYSDVRATAFAQSSGTQFSISFSKQRSDKPLDGRMLLLLSTDPSEEPRMQISDQLRTQMVFGVDVDGLKPDQPVTVDASAWGYPVRSLRDVPAGEYYVQALLVKYETFHRSDGKTVKLPMDQGEGRHWNLTPGNLYSKPVKMTLGKSGAPVKIVLDQEIPPIPDQPDTKYVRHIKIQSDLLTKFWGRPMYLSAVVLVPWGFDEHPEAHYPLMLFHDHFVSGIDDFRTEPPDPNLKPDYSDRFHLSGYNRIQQEEAYKFYQQWISPKFPRYLVVKIQHANPYYDDSYAVNSANLGPYGDAIETELMPALEKKFRSIGQGWARFTYGGSTGGWESLAVQMFYPDHYNGVFCACPDPVDFRAYTLIDLYKEKNAFYLEGPHKQVRREAIATIWATHWRRFRIRMPWNWRSAHTAAPASSGTSGRRCTGPSEPTAIPQPIFNKETGEIDPKIADYWHEHYDLRAILEKNWTTLGPKLQGKIHIYVGSADNYFLNDAVYLMEDFLESTTNPPYDGEVKYGDRAEHCWNGDPTLPNYLSRLHYNTMYLPKIMERIEKTAPPGADLTSWRY